MIDVLTEAIRLGLTGSLDARLPDFMNPAAVSTQQTMMILRTLDAAAQSALLTALERIPGIQSIYGMMHAGNRAWRIDAQGVIKWCVQRAKRVGPKQTASEVVAFCATNSASVCDYLAIDGIAVKQDIKITPLIDIIPFTPTEDSLVSDSLRHVPLHVIPGLSEWNIEHTPPKSVLRRRRVQAPVVLPQDAPFQHLDDSELQELALAMTAIGPTRVTPRVSWTEIPREIPLANFGNLGQWHEPEIKTSAVDRKYAEIDTSAADFLSRYLAMSIAARQKLWLPLQRLGLALVRRSVVDQVVELGIAFEALLIAGETKDELLAVGQERLAVLLGGTRSERETAMDQYKAFYDLRSQAVHQGQVELEGTYKIKNVGKVEAPKFIGIAIGLCQRLILKIVELGAAPDWKSVLVDSKEQALTKEIVKTAPSV